MVKTFISTKHESNAVNVKRFKDFRIFIADRIHPEGVKILKSQGFKVTECYDMHNRGLLEAIKRKISGRDLKSCLIVRSTRRINKKEIDLLKSCSFSLICTASSGYDNIDLKYCRKSGIRVMNVPSGNYISAAEHTVAVILSILKSLSEADKDVRSGIFDEKRYSNHEFFGKKIGIIGVGRVGSHVARLSRAFGAEVLGNDIKTALRYRYKWIKFKGLKALLKESDIVTVHTPLDESTLNLLDHDKLRLLKPDAILVNCARGGIVNEKSVIKLLERGKFLYAGIDVFENEPHINSRFGELNNVFLTPHIAGKTVESRKRISVQLAGRIISYYSLKTVKRD